ncbi:MAG: MFS transporter [Acidobacteria bacterium]|nr:MFS transporter [Acidobacteriota bacterium]
MTDATSRARTLILFSVAYFLSYFFRSANAVLAPDLARTFSLGAADMGLMTSLFYAAFVLVQIPLGVALDRFGARWVTSGLMLVGAVGCAVFAAADTFVSLAIGRALIGAGMGGVLMGALKAISQRFPPQRAVTVSGWVIAIGASGALVAATPLSWFNHNFGWRAVFLAGAAVTALTAMVLMAWAPGVPTGLAREPRGGEPAMRLVFSDRRFWRIALLAFTMTGTMLGFQGLWVGPYLFDAEQVSESVGANLILVLGLSVVAGYAVSGWMADRWGLARVVAVAASAFGLCQVCLALHPPRLALALLFVVFGFCGAFSVTLLSHSRKVFPGAVSGQALTAANLFAIGGTFILQWMIGLVVGAFPRDAAGQYPALAYSAALGMTALALGATLAFYIPLTRESDAGNAESSTPPA